MAAGPLFGGHANPLPYGRDDLDPALQLDKARGTLKCVVRGCEHQLTPPSRKPAFKGDVCPDHNIRVHRAGTFSHVDYRDNLIVDADWFEQHVRRHPFKYECHRFGQERSEDALTWNVFRSLQHAGLLHQVARLCTGIEHTTEPTLFLWGLELRAEDVQPWELLVHARERFESDLPVARPKTEPDIMLYLPGKYVLLIEAKFTSCNGVYVRDTKTKLFDLTIDQLVQIYQDPSLTILDYDLAKKRDRIHYQLWRNLIFSEWIAAQDGRRTRAYHANLVRDGSEEETCEEFLTLIRPEYHDRFEQVSWEQIYGIASQHRDRLDRLCRYLERKTERLRPAFKIPHSPTKENDPMSQQNPPNDAERAEQLIRQQISEGFRRRMSDDGLEYSPPETDEEAKAESERQQQTPAELSASRAARKRRDQNGQGGA